MVGFKRTYAKGRFISWTHADMQTDPEDILEALKILEETKLQENIFLKGKRRNRPLKDTFFTVAMSIFETILLKQPLWDINARANSFSKVFLFESKTPTIFHLIFSHIILLKSCLKIVRIPVQFRKEL